MTAETVQDFHVLEYYGVASYTRNTVGIIFMKFVSFVDNELLIS